MVEPLAQDIFDRLHRLQSEMDKLVSANSKEELFELITRAVCYLSDGDMAWILEPDSTHNSFIMKVATFPYEMATMDHPVKLADSQEGWVYLNQKPITINNLDESRIGLKLIVKVTGKPIKAIMILPLIVQGKTSQVVEIANHHNRRFTQVDQAIISLYLTHAAVCLDKYEANLQSDLIPEFVHELRTPLASLNTALQLLQRPALPTKKRDQISELIQSEFTRLTDLTTSFLDYARLETGKERFNYTRFDLKKLLDEAINIIQIHLDGKGCEVKVVVPSQPLYLDADRDKIKQVLLNLLTNASKYNQSGGSICVEAHQSGGVINFSVEDNGPGIPLEYLPRIFERYYRVPNSEGQVKGTGLGLPISKRIIETHNGKIEITSSPGKGTKVSVQLPIQHLRESVKD